ncbi:unnamed protein product [Prorocentrum cordatum]|uniref:Uncharacterized protein n=1 Tax=Prorocentrum cordatum TaxID=2364126 RepID=A0ABN9TWN7_9DINO|nr:unnamed protein product [Polarella glacialis]
MHWALDTPTAYSGAFGVGAVFGTRLSSTQPCICHCDFGPDRGLLDVIQGQLDRCTAAGLAPAPPRPSSELAWSSAWCWLLAGLGLGIIVGVLLGGYLALALVGRVDWQGSFQRAVGDRPQTQSVLPGTEALHCASESCDAMFKACPGNVYGFDPLSEEQKEDIHLRGLQLARVLGYKVTPSATAGAARRWRVSDPGHSKFSCELEDSDMLPGNRAVVRGDCGLYLVDEDEEDWVSVERVPNRQLDEWLEKKRSGPGRDLRIHPIQRGSAGRRSALLKESVNLFKVPRFEDWPFDGPSVADEVLTEVTKAGLELQLYPTWWESKSGVNPQSSVAREVRLCFDYLRCFQSHDQLNLPALWGVDLICRRVIVCQRAVRRSPKNPDFSGFERFLQASLDDSGGLRTSEFDKHMAESQKTDATVLKQFRLWQEELEADAKRQAAKPGGKSSPG